MEIVRLTRQRLGDVHSTNQPFDLIGRLALRFENGKWLSKEVLEHTGIQKIYPDYDGAKPEEYLDNPDRALFLAYEGDACIGQILLTQTWNGYAHIEDLSVAADWRGRGVGTALFEKAVQWGQECFLEGVSLECQDNNVLAARFFLKMGMEIGGVNTHLYRHLGRPFDEEIALFWYLDFDREALLARAVDAVNSRFGDTMAALAKL
ncbi:MAG: GNAT family N-acetyltransferase [Clostridia bacterium]|nr:GNAT family N-acetyltransferase [Clostridia bacterium]